MAVRAIRQGMRKEKDKLRWVYEMKINIGDLIDRFVAEHKPLEKYFFTGYGLKLQRFDSNLAAFIIEEMTKFHQPVLCIHDSFLATSSCDSFLDELIEEGFNKILGLMSGSSSTFYPKISIIGWRKEDYDLFLEKSWKGYYYEPKLTPGAPSRDLGYENRMSRHNKKPWEPVYYK
jgi:hypothetical protein